MLYALTDLFDLMRGFSTLREYNVIGFNSFEQNSANITVSLATEGLPRGSEPVGGEAPDFSHEAAQKSPFSTTDGGGRGWQSLSDDTWSWRDADSQFASTIEGKRKRIET